jgi:hypothetical protein
METVWTTVLGLGVFLVVLNLLLAIAEIALMGTIRAPAPRNFSYMRRESSQYQTVFAPALAALVSGLFVSLSASFFYAGVVGAIDDGQQFGIVTFALGAVALVVILRLLLKDSLGVAELARDPFAIRAAAEEFALNPRDGALKPELLRQRLSYWESHMSARSLNLSVDRRSDSLDRSLREASTVTGFLAAVRDSLRVYRAAIRCFPLRFGSPLMGFPLFALGVLGVAFLDGSPSGSSPRWINMIAFLLAGLLVALFYCAARGNRARRWHRIHQCGLEQAEQALRSQVAAEDETLRRVLRRADIFLSEQRDQIPHAAEHQLFRVGRFRLVVSG